MVKSHKHFDATLLYRLSENAVKDQITQTWTLNCIQLQLGKWCSVHHKIKLHWVLLFWDNLLLRMSTQGLRPTQDVSSKDQVLGILCSCLLWDISPSRPNSIIPYSENNTRCKGTNWQTLPPFKTTHHWGWTMTYLNIYRVDKDFISRYPKADEQCAKYGESL